MKRLATILTALLLLTATASAMSYEQAREQALFLTDKMAYELNLTEQQYDAAYEINLDYLMSVNSPDDLYEIYWRQRNLDLSYILLDWQYRAYCAATYFYRPLYWNAGLWHFAVYSRYPRRNYFYFGRPNIYVTYRGGHGWRHNGGKSWYKGRTYHHSGPGKGHGMRDRYDRGDYNRRDNNANFDRRHDNDRNMSGNRGNRHNSGFTNRNQSGNTDKMRPNSGFNGNRGNLRTNRESSTRTTARPSVKNNEVKRFGGDRHSSVNSMQRKPSSTFTPRQSTSRPSVSRSAGSRHSVGGGGRSSGSAKGSSRSGGGGGKGNFGGRR